VFSSRKDVEPDELVRALHRRRGLAVVISAPSGTGKTTLCRQLLREIPDLSLSVSVTTRSPRRDEQDGRDYHFISRERFQEEMRSGGLLEWAEVYGHLYGTPREPVATRIEQGKDTVLDIDVQGAQSVKETLREAVLIFLLPPSLAELERRLRTRSSDSADDISVRLQNALTELSRYRLYDYLVVNDDMSSAVSVLKSIVLSERHRLNRIL